MTRVVLIFLILTAWNGLDVVWAQTTLPAQSSQPPVRRALLIGISRYHNLPPLPGATNDVEIIRHVLTTRYEFSSAHVRLLTNEAATRQGILQALRRLVREAGPQDVVYFHFSGHGSQVPDLNGDEVDDQLDETIVPTDGRMEGIPDITDDELGVIFSQLQTRTAILTLDSCHSGSATRGSEVRTRSVPPDTRLFLYETPSNHIRGGPPPISNEYVLMTGAAAHERALDGPVSGKYYGLFSYALYRTLGTIPAETSIQSMFEAVKIELSKLKVHVGRRRMPEPQLEVAPWRLHEPLFPPVQPDRLAAGRAAQLPRFSWISVKPLDKNLVLLENGAFVGAAPGSVWAVYPPGEMVFKPKDVQAYAVVHATRAADAVAHIAPPGIKLPESARAVMLAGAPPLTRVPIAFRDVPQHIGAQLARAVEQGMDGVDLVGAGEFARYLIDVVGGNIRVYSADGVEEIAVFSHREGSAFMKEFSTLLRQARNAEALTVLENPTSRIQLNARVRRGDSGKLLPIFHIRKRDDPRTATNSLQLEIEADTDVYVTIVDVDSDGHIHLLFPNPFQKADYFPEGFVREGTTVVIPDSLAPSNQAGFHWDYTEPPGTDTLKVFASTDRWTAEVIRRYAKNWKSSSSTTQTRGMTLDEQTERENFRLLRGELLGKMTRGVVAVPDRPNEISAHDKGSGLHEFSLSEFFPTMQHVERPASALGTKPQEDASASRFFPSSVSDWTAATITLQIER